MDKYELIQSLSVKLGLGIIGLQAIKRIKEIKGGFSRKRIKDGFEDTLDANILIKTREQKPSENLKKILAYYDRYKNLSLPIIEIETDQL